jgi:hypothetical protein
VPVIHSVYTSIIAHFLVFQDDKAVSGKGDVISTAGAIATVTVPVSNAATGNTYVASIIATNTTIAGSANQPSRRKVDACENGPVPRKSSGRRRVYRRYYHGGE